MKIIKLTGDNKKNNHKFVIKEAIQALRQGGLVIYPTETCYGIGADATNQASIDKLLKYKTMRKDKPISVAVPNKKEAEKYVHINKSAENIYDNFLPGPITVVSKGKGLLAKGVENSLGTQGVRIPKFQFVLDLLKEYKKPITATSANASYKKTPYAISDVLNNISEKQKKMVDLIIDAGTLPKRKPSTVVDTTLENIHIVREGSIKLHKPEVFKAESLNDTKKFVGKIVSSLQNKIGKNKIVFLLQGDLGAGKTYFTKYLAQKFKVKENVVSPTFTLCNEYKGRFDKKSFMVYHIDTYRMYNPEEMNDLKPEVIFNAPNIVVIEWANKVYDYIKPYLKNTIVIDVSIVAPEETVRIFNYKIR
jgi:L-threonylcarbamoyladenylate synthase